ncbi:hypothetical protein B0T24DRAFT_594583 [Lasiosphaeria ovina]|uniref:Uncharacterized protein n=1 Tax=Lasiosphaeria ovina TaxID=92902 RepID=A0AAE0N8B7_9PEZI|nr:hypothetical protein B0T24DRAFT_594583 [Lasiosphaeria ovina]
MACWKKRGWQIKIKTTGARANTGTGTPTTSSQIHILQNLDLLVSRKHGLPSCSPRLLSSSSHPLFSSSSGQSRTHRNIAGQPVSRLWLTFRDQGRLIVTLTISAMVICIAVTAQAGILTAVLASSLLRRYVVPLEKAPGVLMMRATRSFGPGSILSTLSYKHSWTNLEYHIAGILGLCALGLQATSTLLASDLGSAQIPQVSAAANSSFGFLLGGDVLGSGNQAGEGSSPWLSRMVTYPAFAEYAEPPAAVGDGFIDTGLTLRAFLPFTTSQQRESLLDFNGPARVLEAQVVCVRPVVDANVTLRYDDPISVAKARRALALADIPESLGGYQVSDFPDGEFGDFAGGHLSITGDFGWDKALDMLELPQGTFRGGRESGCVIPRPTPNSTETSFTLCALEVEYNLGVATPRTAGVKPLLNPEGRDLNNPEAVRPPIFLVVRGETEPDNWRPDLMDGDFNIAPASGIRFRKSFRSDDSGGGKGPWAVLKPGSADREALTVALCFTSNTIAARHVSLQAVEPRVPEPAWTWSAATNSWDLSGLAPLLGPPPTAGQAHRRPSPLALRMHPLANWTDPNIPDQQVTPYKCPDSEHMGTAADCAISSFLSDHPAGSNGTWRHWEFESSSTFDPVIESSIYLCSHCGANGGATLASRSARRNGDKPDREYRPHRAHTALFQAVMNATEGNVAVALQALVTVLLQGVYYETLPALNMGAPAEFSFVTEMRVPVRWVGIGVVGVLLLAFAVAAAAVVGLFWCQNEEHEFVGETWQGVTACGRGGAVEDVTKGLGMRRDGEVNKMFEGRRVLVGIGMAGNQLSDGGWAGWGDGVSWRLSRVSWENWCSRP